MIGSWVPSVVNPKDINAIRSVVIGTVRSRYSYDELLLKIVDVSVRGSRAVVNIVYSGKVPRAEVAATAIQGLLNAMRNRFRLRKFSFILVNVSKTGSSRGIKFLATTRIPRVVYLAIPRIIEVLKKYNVVVRRWSVKLCGDTVRVSMNCSSGIPEISVSEIKAELRSILDRMLLEKRVCLDIDIHARVNRYELEVCR